MPQLTKPPTPMRVKQLVSTVRQGRKITIDILDEGGFSGYLCGMDDETYFLIIPGEKIVGTEDLSDPVKMLVPKNNILFIELHDESSFMEEPDYEKMVSTVQPFKDHVNNQYFSPTKPAQGK